jgi:peptide chain release factor subunit 1
MLANDVDAPRLRRLAGLRPQGARVLSLYLDLEPSEFAGARARESELTSALHAAERIADGSSLDHDALVAVREDIERAREALSADDLDVSGARAVALFACTPADLFEIVRLPRPVSTHVTIDTSPWIEPLARVAGELRVAVALIDRHHLRLFHGNAHALEEVPPDTDEPARHRSATDNEALTHYVAAGEALLELLKTRAYDALILGARGEERGEIIEHLHAYVRERLAGDIEVDIASATAEQVREASSGLLEELNSRRIGEALARVREGLGRGERAAGGLGDVLAALNERRVETLIYEQGRSLPGVVCPADGWLGVDVGSCPLDGTLVERRENVLENAAEAAILQDADVLVIDQAEHPDLGPHGGIGAVLRF